MYLPLGCDSDHAHRAHHHHPPHNHLHDLHVDRECSGVNIHARKEQLEARRKEGRKEWEWKPFSKFWKLVISQTEESFE